MGKKVTEEKKLKKREEMKKCEKNGKKIMHKV